MALAKEQIRQIISQNDISSVADIYSLLKDSFKDILQELMEAEMDATLGYEKNQKGDLVTRDVHCRIHLSWVSWRGKEYSPYND